MSWEDFERKDEAGETKNDEWARLHAVVFASGAGRELIQKYHAMLVDRPLGAEVSESALRHSNAQRQLVRSMEALTARGLGLSKPKTSV